MSKRKRIYLWLHPVDPMRNITVCRNCGKPVAYGKLINHTGHDACPDCFDDLRNRILYIREHDYEQYRRRGHFYGLSKEDYKKICNRLIDKKKALVSEIQFKYGGPPQGHKMEQFLEDERKKLEVTE